MAEKPELPILEVPDQAAWRQWLQSNHDAAAGVWLKFAKKGSPVKTVTYGEAVEEALCFGWIDGQARRLDEHFYLQRFTPAPAPQRVAADHPPEGDAVDRRGAHGPGRAAPGPGGPGPRPRGTPP